MLYTQQKKNGKISLLISTPGCLRKCNDSCSIRNTRRSASENESTIALYATKEKWKNSTTHLHAGVLQKMNRLLLYTQQKRNGKIPLLISTPGCLRKCNGSCSIRNKREMEKFHYSSPRPGASENESALALYATEEKWKNSTTHLHAGVLEKMNRLLLYTQ
ncbi:MAG: hypothetical protein F6K40_32495 [Okeania sp. SIO3I5]|uniref:hypothetical protein n=1 Tax=Okeania sp. SIO3I5 TaxID=2607805 RepID=UPI0013BC5BA3|nr:hypothetical protein [Okeania sp. SIO3I5]NEQ40692.1 hypothetical protein [Okeania sp. SIO3I5]